MPGDGCWAESSPDDVLGGNPFNPDLLMVSTYKRTRAGQAGVLFALSPADESKSDAETMLTPTAARTLAAKLVAAADLADGTDDLSVVARAVGLDNASVGSAA